MYIAVLIASVVSVAAAMVWVGMIAERRSSRARQWQIDIAEAQRRAKRHLELERMEWRNSHRAAQSLSERLGNKPPRGAA
jgi:hypothetical protein